MNPTPDKRPWYYRWQIWLIWLVLAVSTSIIYLQVNRTPEISTTSGPIGQNITPKQRMIFAVSLEKSFRKRGWAASMDIAGEDGKTLKVYWPELNLPYVKQMVNHQQIITDIREMGFKRLVLRNNDKTWNIDLKN